MISGYLGREAYTGYLGLTRHRQFFDIRDYGAVEGADATNAIQRAINECWADGGGRVYVPNGIWGISAALIMKSSVTLCGAGGAAVEGAVTDPAWAPATTLLWEGAAGGTMISGTSLSGASLQDFTLDGAHLATIGVDWIACQGGGMERVSMRKMGSQASPANPGIGLHLEALGDANAHMLTFTGLIIEAATCIEMDGPAADLCRTLFLNTQLLHGSTTGNQPAINAVVCDNVTWVQTDLNRQFGTGYGVHLRENARNHKFLSLHPGPGGLRCEAPTNAAWSNMVWGYNRGDGAPAPSLAVGASLDYHEGGVSGTGAYLNKRGINIGSAKWSSGTGSPEGVVTATKGSLWSATDGGAGACLWVKESDTANTGWKQVTTS